MALPVTCTLAAIGPVGRMATRHVWLLLSTHRNAAPRHGLDRAFDFFGCVWPAVCRALG